MATPLSSAHRAWRTRIFATTWLSYVGFYFCRKPFSVAKSSMQDEAGWDAATLGDIWAAYLIAYAIGQFLASRMGTALGPRRNVLLGMALSICATVAMGLTLSWQLLAGLAAINGIAQATGWSGNVGTMAGWFHRHERGRVMGAWSTNFTVGALTSGWVMSWVLSLHDRGEPSPWRWCFYAGSLVLIAVWIQFYYLQRNRPEDIGLAPVDDPQTEVDEAKTPDPDAEPAVDERSEAMGGGSPVGSADRAGGKARRGIVRLSRTAWINLLLVSGFYFFAKFIRYAVWSWAAYFLVKTYDRSSSEAALYSTAFDLAGLFGVVATGWISDRWFASRRAEISLIMVLGMTVATGLLMVFGDTSVALFVVLLAAVGFTLYGPDALLTGAGAIDIGGRGGATFAAAVISGFGSLGPVVQEVVIPRLYGRGELAAVLARVARDPASVAPGQPLGLVLVLLFGSAALAALFCAVLVLRNRRGGNGV